MFDKALFFSLCEKYKIELSDSIDKPMIKDADGVHPITDEDVRRVFSPRQTYFAYSTSKATANVVFAAAYYAHDDFAAAC